MSQSRPRRDLPLSFPGTICIRPKLFLGRYLNLKRPLGFGWRDRPAQQSFPAKTAPSPHPASLPSLSTLQIKSVQPRKTGFNDWGKVVRQTATQAEGFEVISSGEATFLAKREVAELIISGTYAPHPSRTRTTKPLLGTAASEVGCGAKILALVGFIILYLAGRGPGQFIAFNNSSKTGVTVIRARTENIDSRSQRGQIPTSRPRLNWACWLTRVGPIQSSC